MNNYILLFSLIFVGLASCTKEAVETTENSKDTLLETRMPCSATATSTYTNLCDFWEPLTYGGPGNSSCGYNSPSASCCRIFSTIPGSSYTVTSYGHVNEVNQVSIMADAVTGCIEICPSLERPYLMHIEMINMGNYEETACTAEVEKLKALMEFGMMTCDFSCGSALLLCPSLSILNHDDECCVTKEGFPGAIYNINYGSGSSETIETDETGVLKFCVKKGDTAEITFEGWGGSSHEVPSEIINLFNTANIIPCNVTCN